MAKSDQKERLIYQLKVTLKDSKPPIWRRIQVVSDVSLAKLHQILQVAMGKLTSYWVVYGIVNCDNTI